VKIPTAKTGHHRMHIIELPTWLSTLRFHFSI